MAQLKATLSPEEVQELVKAHLFRQGYVVKGKVDLETSIEYDDDRNESYKYAKFNGATCIIEKVLDAPIDNK